MQPGRPCVRAAILICPCYCHCCRLRRLRCCVCHTSADTTINTRRLTFADQNPLSDRPRHFGGRGHGGGGGEGGADGDVDAVDGEMPEWKANQLQAKRMMELANTKYFCEWWLAV
jgi:hypothetical protein